MNTNTSTSQSGIFTPRIVVAFALCCVGVVFGMFSLAATPPVETKRAATGVMPDPATFSSAFGSNANSPAAVAPLAEAALPSGVPLPRGTHSSVNEQGDPSSSSPTAGFPGFAGMPLRPGTGSGANSLRNPVLANQQPAPLTSQPAGASESMPLAPAAAGSWSIVPSPNVTGSQNYNLYGVTCVSASDCWAVGWYYTPAVSGGYAQTLIERWDGTSWAIVSSPSPSPTQYSSLYTVTCVSASNCWAVGYNVIITPLPTGGIGTSQTLIEHWDGTSWAIVPSPNTVAFPNNYLYGVTCVSASNCWAVGQSGTAINDSETLIERWDGASWAIVSSPNAPGAFSSLISVTCVSASNCWAVGQSGTLNTTPHQTLVERWDGASWAIVSSPNTSTTQSNFLQAVTCASASECWAVGYYQSGTDSNQKPIYQTLVEGWDGASWAIVSSNPNILNGVACASASECWAVGYDNVNFNTLIEHWDGTSWTIVSSPTTGLFGNYILNGVACASASECWAVGFYDSHPKTLVLRYSTPPTLTSVVSRKTHGTAGDFDIDLPVTGTRGVECRSGGANNDYTMVFSFLNPVANCGAASTGSVSNGPNPNQCTVNLTGVPNAQYLTVTLTGAVDSTGATGNVSGTMGVLVGDVNATGLVDGNDVSAVQGQARQTANSTNFRLDVNATGLIDGNDVSLVQSKTRTSLPSPP